MTVAEVVTPDQVTDTSGRSFTRTDDPHAENAANYTPCPQCGANAHEGPEGDHWRQFQHCWRCGWSHVQKTPVSPNAIVSQLPPGAMAAIAKGIADEVKTLLGLGSDERIVPQAQLQPVEREGA